MERIKCSVEGCNNEVYGRGICQPHYSQARHRQTLDEYEAKRCTVEGCNKPAYSKSYCNFHHRLITNHEAIRNPKCRIADCESPPIARGLCRIHYDTLRATGKITEKGKDEIRTICKECYYRRPMTGNDSTACHYCIDNDKLRGCKPTEFECEKFKSRGNGKQ